MWGSARSELRSLSVLVAVNLWIFLFCSVAPALDVDTYFTRGAVAIGNKEFDRAYQIYSEGLERSSGDPDRSKLLRFRAFTSDLAGKPEQAEADYSAAVELSGSTDPAVYRSRGLFYFKRDRFVLALADYTAGAGLFPSNGEFPSGQGLVLSAQGQFDAAILRFDEAIRLDPASAEYRLGRAEAYNQSDRPQLALQDYDKALALGHLVRNDIGRLRSGRGYAQLRLKRYDAAIADFDAAIELRPGLIDARKWRALCFERLGDIARACRDYAASLKLDPSDDVLATRTHLLCKS